MREFKCVVLVIASENDSFPRFKEIWEAHWQANIRLLGSSYARFYLYNDPTASPAGNSPENMNLRFPHEETYPSPGLLLKTLDALQFLKDNDIKFDMVFRTNLSSLIDWAAFAGWVSRIGVGVISGRKYDDRHISGCGMLLPKAVADEILAHRAELDQNQPDDHAINLYLHAHHPFLRYEEFPNATPTNEDEMRMALQTRPKIVHYRFYSGQGRNYDIELMAKMTQLLDGSLFRRPASWTIGTPSIWGPLLIIIIVVALCISILAGYRRYRMSIVKYSR